MLNQLLVLGLVPGTNFQITFSDLMILVEMILIYYLLRHKLPHPQAIRKQLEYYRLYTYLYLSTKKGRQLSLPV